MSELQTTSRPRRPRPKAVTLTDAAAERVREILDKLNEAGDGAFTNYTKTFLDPSCGDGQFLVHVMLVWLPPIG